MSDHNSGSENQDNRIIGDEEIGVNEDNNITGDEEIGVNEDNRIIGDEEIAITNCLTWKPSYRRIPPTPDLRSSSAANSPGQPLVSNTPVQTTSGQTSGPFSPGQPLISNTPVQTTSGQTSVPFSPGQTMVSNTPDQPLVHTPGQTDPDDDNSGSDNEDDRILDDVERGRNRQVNRVIFPSVAATLALPSQGHIPPTPALHSTSISNTLGQTDPGQTHVPDPTPRRTRPMPQPEWWTPPPPPPFPITDLPPSSSSNTPIAYVTVEQRDYLKYLESMRGVLSNLELEVERRCEEIVSLYLGNTTLFLVVITGGSMLGNLFSNNSSTIYSFLGLVVICLLLGLGMAFFFSWMKLNSFRWRMSQIQEWREQFNGLVVTFDDTIQIYPGVPDPSSNMTLVVARNRSSVLRSSLTFGSFRLNHMIYFIVGTVWAFIYVVAIIIYIVVMSPASPNHIFRGGAPL